jgi:hypothetical protein
MKLMTTPVPGSKPSPRGVLRMIASPALYIGWTVASFAGLAITWTMDPWIFAITTLAVGLGTIGVGLAGIIAQVKAEPEIRTRVIIAGAITSAGLLVAVALVLLSRIKWA